MAWSQFYGTVKGRASSNAARCGTKESGLRVFAASKTGAMVVYMYHREGKDCFEARLVPWCDGRFADVHLFTGHFVPGEESPVLRLNDSVVQQHVHAAALKVMTKE